MLTVLASPLSASVSRAEPQLGIVYTADVLHNVSGGYKTGGAYLDNLDVTLDVDLADSLGGHAFAYVLYNNGASFSESYVGDAQVISNIETVRAWRLYELWYEHPLQNGAATVRAGLYDLNSEFYATDSSSLFMHASHGIGTDFSQSGEMGPSIFSITGLAVRIQHEMSSSLSWRAAVLDGVPGDPDHPDRNLIKLDGEEGLLAVAEADFHPGSYRVGMGAWRYSRRQPAVIETDDVAISWGSYGYAEWAPFADALEDAELRLFLRGGIAEDQVNRFADFIGAGFVVDGDRWGRPDDTCGLAVARAHNGNAYRDSMRQIGETIDSAETAVELSYRFGLGERFVVQPDVQYILNPDTVADRDNATVVGLRFELTLN